MDGGGQPMADFAALVAKDLEAGDYSRVLLDLRNNGGGSELRLRWTELSEEKSVP